MSSLTKKDFFKYLEQGWSVFPVALKQSNNGKIEKKPMVPWKKYQTEFATLEEIEEWVKKKPNGIGVVTGELSQIVVVDVDQAENPIKLSSPIVVKSAFSGGRHYYYRWTEALKNKVSIDGMKIDFRGDGGFVVAPPSMYGSRGYTFEKETPPMYLTELPKEIVEMLETKQKTPFELELDLNVTNPYPSVSEGGRNDTAARVAGSLLQKIDIHLWDMAAWGSLRQWNQEKCDPPLPERELRATFESVKRAELAGRRNGEVVDTSKVVQPMAFGDVAIKRVEERALEKLAPSTGYPLLDDMIKGFVPGHVYVLSGDTNVGKTQMCANFTDRVSRQGKKVLYFALEPENTIVDYVASIRTQKRFDDLTTEDILKDDPNIQIYSKEQIRKIEELVGVVRGLPRYDLIIVDHIGYFTTAAGKTLDMQSDVMKRLSGLAKSKRCAIMVVAHIRKRQSRKPQLHEDDISGSGAFKQDTTEVLLIVRESNKDETGSEIYTNMGSILVRKTKSGRQGSMVIEFQEGGALILDSHQMAEDLLA